MSALTHLFVKPKSETDFRAANSEGGFGRNPEGRLEEFASTDQSARFLKWSHYFGVYQRHFESWLRGRSPQPSSPRVLEIGVFKGGSLKMWRDFFGPEATIFGIDIDERCASLGMGIAEIRIGSQSDPSFLAEVVGEMGGIDIIIDDGSHKSKDVIASFLSLFPFLADGGIYIIEDLHASYWPRFGGGWRRRGSSIEFLKTLVDEMHRPYLAVIPRWLSGPLPENLGEQIKSIEFSDSMCVVRKGQARTPEVFLSAGWSAS